MLSERQRKIKHLIETSTVLNEHEQDEWLQLLELMNDKQLSELEEILNPVVSKPSQFSMPSSPPMSHISNMPTGISLPQGHTEPTFPHTPAKSKWQEDMKLIMTEKELTAPAPTFVQNVRATNLPAGLPASFSKPPAPKTIPQPEFKSRVVEPPKPIENAVHSEPPVHVAELVKLAPTPFRAEAPVPTPTSVRNVGTASAGVDSQEATKVLRSEVWKPKTALDANGLSIAAYRSMGAQAITNLLQELVKREGYVRVLINLEKSNFYKSYLVAGQNFLNPQAATSDVGHAAISKNEFEEIVDILRKIQVN